MLNLRKIIFFIIIFFVTTYISYGQKDIRDSLSLTVHKSELLLTSTLGDSVYVNQLNSLGKNLRYYNNDSLLNLSQKALKYSIKIKYYKGQVDAYSNIGNYYSDKGEYLKSIEILQTGISIANENNLLNSSLESQNSVASQYFFLDDYDQSLKHYLYCLELAKELHNVKMFAVLNQNIAILYATLEDYDEGLVYYKRANELFKEMDDAVFVATSTINLANMYCEIGNLDEAKSHLNKALAFVIENELLEWIGFGYQVKAKIFFKQKKYELARVWYEKSQKLYDEKLDHKRLETLVLNGLAETNFCLDNNKLAKEYALKSLGISRKLGKSRSVEKSLEILYKISKKQKDFKTELEYLEEFSKVTLSNNQNINKKNVLMFKVKQNYENQRKNLIAENEKAVTKQKKKVYVVLAILVLVLMVTLITIHNDKIQIKLNKELQSKKNSLEINQLSLKNSNKTKDLIFSIIGHDLREPINSFQSVLKLFKDEEIDQADFLRIVPKLRTNIDNISLTLNNLLYWGQAQIKSKDVHFSSISINKIVSQNVALLSDFRTKKTITINNKVDLNVFAWCDADQVCIIIRNLLSNALKFTPEKGEITIEAIEKNKEYWVISVQDTGVGIDTYNLDKIFDQNFNITTYGTHNERGTGLGLKLCKEMIKNNKGEIWAESVLNQGSRFYITLLKEKLTNV